MTAETVQTIMFWAMPEEWHAIKERRADDIKKIQDEILELAREQELRSTIASWPLMSSKIICRKETSANHV